MAGERHGNGILCVNRPLDRATTGIGKEVYSTFKSATVSPLNSSSPHQARSFHPILRPYSQYMKHRQNYFMVHFFVCLHVLKIGCLSSDFGLENNSKIIFQYFWLLGHDYVTSQSKHVDVLLESRCVHTKSVNSSAAESKPVSTGL